MCAGIVVFYCDVVAVGGGWVSLASGVLRASFSQVAGMTVALGGSILPLGGGLQPWGGNLPPLCGNLPLLGGSVVHLSTVFLLKCLQGGG